MNDIKRKIIIFNLSFETKNVVCNYFNCKKIANVTKTTFLVANDTISYKQHLQL